MRGPTNHLASPDSLKDIAKFSNPSQPPFLHPWDVSRPSWQDCDQIFKKPIIQRHCTQPINIDSQPIFLQNFSVNFSSCFPRIFPPSRKGGGRGGTSAPCDEKQKFSLGKTPPLLWALNHGTTARLAARLQQGTPWTFLGTTYPPKNTEIAFLLLPLLYSLLSLPQPLDMLAPRLPANLSF